MCYCVYYVYNTLISICHPFPLTVDIVNLWFHVDNIVRVSQLVVWVLCWWSFCYPKPYMTGWIGRLLILWKCNWLWRLAIPNAFTLLNFQGTKVKMWNKAYCQAIRRLLFIVLRIVFLLLFNSRIFRIIVMDTLARIFICESQSLLRWTYILTMFDR